MITSLRLSVGLFTAVPVGEVPGADRPRVVRRAVLLAPLVGVGLGIGAELVLVLFRNLANYHSATGGGMIYLTSALAIGWLAMTTRALHLDGLADTVDAMAAGGDAEHRLAVMRRSDVGPMGVVAILVALLIDVLALAVALARGHGTLALLTAVVAGRLAAVWACRFPAARPDGLGAWVAGSTTVPLAAVVSALCLSVPVAALWLDDDPRLQVLPYALAAIPVALGVTALLQRWWRRSVGGITGDTIGAGVEIATTIALVVVAMAPS